MALFFLLLIWQPMMAVHHIILFEVDISDESLPKYDHLIIISKSIR